MGRVALVTGAGRGIGAAIASRLRADGCRVVGVDLAFDAGQGPAWVPLPGRAPAPPLGHDGESAPADDASGRAWSVTGDLADAAFRDDLVAAVVAAFGRIDVLVNNAGVSAAKRGDLLEVTPESWERVLGINLTATMFLTQAVARVMVAQEPVAGRRGDIVNLGSLNSWMASPDRVEYCVSKAGVSMLTSVFAARLAGDGVRVNEVRPGVIETAMTAVAHDKYSAMIEAGAFPIARWGRPADVADAVAVLCSTELAYTTGQVLHVDGGFHLPRL
ncbi:3-ketoacyl-ACP reductase [Propioniciclava coleopterorum]|uniref:3-ketoacyl-ACP reductase n=1 Tax=Propioniciclava coleopterorum TaxID=2714937 RepID=A0A6G7Y4H8_9ACTN|nr:3-ketoacyl-ACP reductase [Propioniciclava coleopterorum]QIK71531.1 3-ketoacyl-ACP reductase [Propioniciclava coleopterorum]